MKLRITVDGKPYEVEVEVIEDSEPKRPAAYVPPRTPVTAVPLPRAAGSAVDGSEEAVADESKVCRSPVAGTVVRLNAQSGQEIQANDVLVVLDAMNAETDITAPIGGKLRNIAVSAGDIVKLNQVVAEFE